MEVNVPNGLPRRRPVVQTEVESVGRMFAQERGAAVVQQFEHGVAFSVFQLEKRGNVPTRNDQHVAG